MARATLYKNVEFIRCHKLRTSHVCTIKFAFPGPRNYRVEKFNVDAIGYDLDALKRTYQERRRTTYEMNPNVNCLFERKFVASIHCGIGYQPSNMKNVRNPVKHRMFVKGK